MQRGSGADECKIQSLSAWGSHCTVASARRAWPARGARSTAAQRTALASAAAQRPALPTPHARHLPPSSQPSASAAAAAPRRSVAAAAVAAEPAPAAPANPYRQPAGKGMGFYTGEDGYLYCDNMRVDDIRAQVRRPACAAL